MLSICSGQAAALAGGTTFHIDFALPVNGDIAKGLKRYQDVSKRAVMDYSFHMAITTWNDKVLSTPSEMTQSDIYDIGNPSKIQGKPCSGIQTLSSWDPPYIG